MHTLTTVFKAVFTCLALLAASAATAQAPAAYPSRPIQFIVPFAAGTTADIIARLLGEYLSKDLGQPIVVDNRPGAGGTLGANAAARAASDGHTLVLGTVASHAIATIAFPNVAYDPVRDFEPITLIANVPNLLVVNRSVPVSNAAELVAYAKKTGGLNFTSAGTGTTSQLAGELIRLQLGAPLTHVPYKSGSQALTDVVSGIIPVMIWQVSPLKPHIASGAIKPIAALSASRIASFPEVPTLAETLLPGFDSSAWFGVLAPRGTARNIVDRLHETIKRALDAPDVRDRFEKLGLERAEAGPEQFREIIVNDLKRWQPVVQSTKPESK
jgi:tripartite-type tricarboxylate transporter receptor subunit TctC